MTPRPPLTRAAIVAAARDLVAAEGLDACSVRRVAARLGVTAPALYAHIDDKDDLLRAVAELEFTRLIERFDAIGATEPDPLARVRAHARAYVDHALEDPALFRVMFLYRPAWSPQPNAQELPLATKAFEHAAAAVEEAMAAGRLRAGDPLLASLAIWSAAHGVATVILAGIDLGPEYERRLADTVVDAVISGLADREEKR
ncbi:MAG: TetR family transcriptional regulator [Acidimicrobiia bacterium]|nr:MAG: TetR family transcriptional regulator [Acidimicrobiia bacterium]